MIKLLRFMMILVINLLAVKINAANTVEIEYLNEFEKIKDESQRLYNIFWSMASLYNKNPNVREKTIFRRDIDQAGYYYNRIRHPLILKYAWAIPNQEALETIKSYSPIFELGAGGGYWAKLLSDLGTEVVAVDKFNDKNSPYEPSKSWIDVIEGDESLIENYPEHTLFICWPDPRTRAGGSALEKYHGTYVLYIGYDISENSQWMGDYIFYSTLSTQFKKIKEITIPTWPGNDDKLYVFERL